MSVSEDDLLTFTGTVTELEVESTGQASAMLQFLLSPLKGEDEPQTFVVLADAEPQAFAAIATMLTAAYTAKLIVTVTYVLRAGGSPKATNVKLSTTAETKSGRMGFV